MGVLGSAPRLRQSVIRVRFPGGSGATRPVLFLYLFVAAVASGCGSSSTGPTPPPPPQVNALPVVNSIVVRGTNQRQPAQYASLGDTVNVTATVTDAETPVSQLTYEWSSSVGGTFSGSGASVAWTAPPAAGTPVNAILTLAVIERFGNSQTNRVTATSTVDLHNSPKEVGDLAWQFLEDFSRQLPVDTVMRNFTDACPGTANERQDVLNQQRDVAVIDSNIGTPETVVPFGGTCPFIDRNPVGDACSRIPVRWVSRIRSTGQISISSGVDQVTAVFEAGSPGRWRLCASDYHQQSTSGANLLRYWIQH